eukprot:1656421-Pleurochrysis_carterae.AAC.3
MPPAHTQTRAHMAATVQGGAFPLRCVRCGSAPPCLARGTSSMTRFSLDEAAASKRDVAGLVCFHGLVFQTAGCCKIILVLLARMILQRPARMSWLSRELGATGFRVSSTDALSLPKFVDGALASRARQAKNAARSTKATLRTQVRPAPLDPS